MGMRVKAKWADELKPDHRRSSGSSRPANPTPTTSTTRTTSDARRSGCLVRVSPRSRATPSTTRSRCSCRPCARRSRSRASTRNDIGFTCSGSLDYLQGGPFAFVMGLDAVGCVAADPREPRRDGRGVGAVRGVGRDPDRRSRQRARVRLRQVVARRPARDHDAADRPVLRRCRCGRRWSTWPRCRRARTSRRAVATSATSPRSRRVSQRNAQANPHAVRKGDVTRRRRARRSR